MGRKRIHDFITDTWNPLVGCRHYCVYCWARRLANTRLRHLPQYELGFDHVCFIPDKLHYIGKNQGVFVCDMGDMFGDWIPRDWISLILKAARSANSTNTFFFETKNPIRFSEFLGEYPEKSILSATIETDIDHCVTKAPSPRARISAMAELRRLWPGKIHIAIEPIQTFRPTFVDAIGNIQPDIVSVGWNNRRDFGGQLPEPTVAEVDDLIRALSAFTDVREKESVRERKGIKSESELTREYMKAHPEVVEALERRLE